MIRKIICCSPSPKMICHVSTASSCLQSMGRLGLFCESHLQNDRRVLLAIRQLSQCILTARVSDTNIATKRYFPQVVTIQSLRELLIRIACYNFIQRAHACSPFRFRASSDCSPASRILRTFQIAAYHHIDIDSFLLGRLSIRYVRI